MKKIHIIGIVAIALSIGAILSTLSESSTYSDFNTAFANPGSEFHVIGKLNKKKPTLYEPTKNPDIFQFYMIDTSFVEKKVILHKSKPQDFERSEQIVIIGKAIEEDFHASEILLKCPSKYNDSNKEFE